MGMKRTECHKSPIDEVLQARMDNSLTHYEGVSDEMRELIVEDVGRTIRGLLLETYLSPTPITFPEHDDIPDLYVRVGLFDGDKLGR
jgi:hypothetical protein